MSSGSVAVTMKIGTSTTWLIVRSTATLQIVYACCAVWALPRVGYAVIDPFRQFEHVPASPGGVSEVLHGQGVVLDTGQVQEVQPGAG